MSYSAHDRTKGIRYLKKHQPPTGVNGINNDDDNNDDDDDDDEELTIQVKV